MHLHASSKPTGRLLRYAGLCLALLLSACATGPQSAPDLNTPGQPLPRPPDASLDWGKLAQEFRSSLQETRFDVERLPQGGLRMRIPSALSFDEDSTAVRPNFRATLSRIGALLRTHQDLKLTVVGHTDSLGPELYNQKLSLDRADAVAQVLMQGGIPFTRVATVGKGETEPIGDNNTEAGRAANRRVELLIHATGNPD